MPTSTNAAIPASLSDDATFRAWGLAISNALGIAGGLVQVHSTINWTTVSRPGSINTAAGHEVYRLDDALQATSPLFFKIRYGVGSSVSQQRLWLSIGRAHNGSGTLTADTSTEYSIASLGVTTAGVTGSMDICSRPDGMVMVLYPDVGSSDSFIAAVGRGHDNDGDPLSDRIYMACFEANVLSNNFVTIWRPTIGYASDKYLPMVQWGEVAFHGNVGGDIPLHVPVIYSGAEKWNVTEFLTYYVSGIADNQVVPVTTLGDSKTYKTIGSRLSRYAAGGSDNLDSTSGWAIRWE